MNALSPLTRRIVAVGLLVLVLLLGLQCVVLPLATAIVERREELGAVRAREARLAAAHRRLFPDVSTMPSGLALHAASRADAEARLRALVTGSAAIAGIPVTISPASASPDDRRVRVAVAADGPEGAVIAFASLVEQGSPLIRFEQWRLQAGTDPGRTLAFAAVAVAVWDHRR